MAVIIVYLELLNFIIESKILFQWWNIILTTSALMINFAALVFLNKKAKLFSAINYTFIRFTIQVWSKFLPNHNATFSPKKFKVYISRSIVVILRLSDRHQTNKKVKYFTSDPGPHFAGHIISDITAIFHLGSP